MSSDDSSVMSSDTNSFTGHVLDPGFIDSPKIIEFKRERDLVLCSSSDCEESISNDFVPKLPIIDFATLNNSTPNTLNSDYDSISSNEDHDDADNPGTTTDLKGDDLNTPDNTVNSVLIQYLDQQCHSIFPQWTSPIHFPDKNRVMCNITQYSIRSYQNRVILGPTHKQY